MRRFIAFWHHHRNSFPEQSDHNIDTQVRGIVDKSFSLVFLIQTPLYESTIVRTALGLPSQHYAFLDQRRLGFFVQRSGSDSHFRIWTCTITIAATRIHTNENAQSPTVPKAIILMHAVTFVDVLASALFTIWLQMRTKKLSPKCEHDQSYATALH
jgi:hypothetical protein